MKKLLLSTCALLVVITTFAQQTRMAKMPIKKDAKKYVAIVPATNTLQSISSASPFFTNTFSNPGDWIINPSSNGQNWVIGTNAPTGTYSSPMGAIASTTATDGFAMYDSDALGTSNTNTQDATITYNGTVDCSLYSYVNINFESFHRKFQDSVFVEVSNDGWATFDRFEVHDLQGVNDQSDNPETVSVNITSVAGNQTSVSFRFHYEGQWDYAWMVDDVSFSETPDNLITTNSEVIGGFWIDYANYSGAGSNDIYGLDYSVTPLSQLANHPYVIESYIKNEGIVQQYVMLKYDVTGTATASGASSIIVLNASEDTVCSASPSFSPSIIGDYSIDIWGQSDSLGLGVIFTNTDTVTKTIEVTEYIYGKDLGSSNPGTYRVGGPVDQNHLTTRYEMYADEQLYSLRTFISDKSSIGAEIKAILYETDTTSTNGLLFLDESDNYTITTQDLGSWVDIPFVNPILLLSGYAYECGIVGFQHPTDSSFIGTSGNSMYNGEHSVFDELGLSTQSAGVATWYYTTSAPMIRMNFDPGSATLQSFDCIGISCVDPGDGNGMYSSFSACEAACSPNGLEEEKTSISIFPNPSNGIFVVELDAISQYDVTVYNVLGQSVFFTPTTTMITTIDLSSFEKGIYTIELKDKNSSYFEKVVVE